MSATPITASPPPSCQPTFSVWRHVVPLGVGNTLGNAVAAQQARDAPPQCGLDHVPKEACHNDHDNDQLVTQDVRTHESEATLRYCYRLRHTAQTYRAQRCYRERVLHGHSRRNCPLIPLDRVVQEDFHAQVRLRVGIKLVRAHTCECCASLRSIPICCHTFHSPQSPS